MTRTVRDRKGNVIHSDTYYSNYARITGIVLVGRGSDAPSDGRPAAQPGGPCPARAVAQALGDRLGLGRADPEPAQRVARHLDRQLALAVDGLDPRADRRAGARPPCRCGCARRCPGPVRIGPGALDDQARSRGIGRGDDHQAGPLDVGQLEDLRVRRVAVDRRRCHAPAGASTSSRCCVMTT